MIPLIAHTLGRPLRGMGYEGFDCSLHNKMYLVMISVIPDDLFNFICSDLPESVESVKIQIEIQGIHIGRIN